MYFLCVASTGERVSPAMKVSNSYVLDNLIVLEARVIFVARVTTKDGTAKITMHISHKHKIVFMRASDTHSLACSQSII